MRKVHGNFIPVISVLFIKLVPLIVIFSPPVVKAELGTTSTIVGQATDNHFL